MGSLLGSAGDGSADLERLIQNYGFSREGITTLYVSLVWLSGLMWLVVYGVFALRALRQIRAKAMTGASSSELPS